MDSIVPQGNILQGTITPPCSKSYAQRALAAALLASGRTTLRGIELCRDTRSAIAAIEALGAKVEITNENTIAIEGGLNPRTDNLNVGESGLAARLFTPIAALANKRIRIAGEGTLLHRPMSMMIAPLQELGLSSLLSVIPSPVNTPTALLLRYTSAHLRKSLLQVHMHIPSFRVNTLISRISFLSRSQRPTTRVTT